MNAELETGNLYKETITSGPEMVLVAGNRGPCGGVNMALLAVDRVMEIVPAKTKVHVSHSPVNFRPVFAKYGDRLVDVKGDISKVPDGGDFIISAHGAPPEIFEEARRRGITVIDTTCAIVKDEQKKIREDAEAGYHVAFVGEDDHPETIGIKGQVKEGDITILDPRKLPDVLTLPEKTRVYSKTTNSPSDVADAMNLITSQNPNADASMAHQCYAVHNRQVAAREMIDRVDFWLVVGDVISHNTRQLERIGVKKEVPSRLVSRPEEVDWGWFSGVVNVGLTSGASVPEEYTQVVLDLFRKRQIPVVELEQAIQEADRTFKLPVFDELTAKYRTN